MPETQPNNNPPQAPEQSPATATQPQPAAGVQSVNPPAAGPYRLHESAPPAAPAPGGPVTAAHYDGKGQLTRAGMEHVIRGGGSIVHNGRVINNAAALPSAVELAGGDERALDAAEADLDRREQSLAAERARLATARRQADQRQPQQPADAPPKDGKAKGK